ncbi:alpha/beta hydrolase family protein [Rubrivirga sp. IMCC43871]|uniref:alpha/beta hydrolase family protein n=1 Tax=Rubrivirga sp. IMCC43871 TaxID=3391575 RepID=UPI0039901765
MPAPLHVLAARPIRVGGLAAVRYRLRREHAYSGDPDLDAALSTFGAVVLPPADGRSGAAAVTLLNGITRGLDRSLPAATALARAGIAAVLIDTPLGGERRPTSGPPQADLADLARRGVALDAALARRLFDGVAADLGAVLAWAQAEHGVGAERRALFGVSFGAALSSLAFARDGVGDRLFGAIGHPDLPALSRGLVDTFTRFSGLPSALVTTALRLGPVAEAAARRAGGEAAVGAVRFARLLAALGAGGRAVDGLDPVGFAPAVSADRPVHLLAGALDPVAPPAVMERAASAFAVSSVEVLPSMGHGWYPGAPPPGAPSFGAASGAWLVRHLADWR